MSSMEEFVKWISCIEDERQQSKVMYTVQEIVLIVFSATLSGIYEWESMELWAEQNISLLRSPLKTHLSNKKAARNHRQLTKI